eukprot:scaffold133437_cov84-Phaeocystis_antarctica.AAC.1
MYVGTYRQGQHGSQPVDYMTPLPLRTPHQSTLDHSPSAVRGCESASGLVNQASPVLGMSSRARDDTRAIVAPVGSPPMITGDPCGGFRPDERAARVEAIPPLRARDGPFASAPKHKALAVRAVPDGLTVVRVTRLGIDALARRIRAARERCRRDIVIRRADLEAAAGDAVV